MTKVYLYFENGYITDIAEVNPNRTDYIEYQFDKYPNDLMCGCYQIVDGKIILDKQKHDKWECENQEAEKEL